MGSISSVLTLGLGNWGSIGLLINLGFGVEEIVAATPGCAHASDSALYTCIASDEKC